VTARLNTEFDSRILRVSTSMGGRTTRPAVSHDGRLEQVYCLHCGKPGGAVTAGVPAFLRHDPGLIYICNACDGTFGKLPAQAVGFEHRKE
jgi:hypothetical protein